MQKCFQVARKNAVDDLVITQLVAPTQLLLSCWCDTIDCIQLPRYYLLRWLYTETAGPAFFSGI